MDGYTHIALAQNFDKIGKRFNLNTEIEEDLSTEVKTKRLLG